MQATELKVPVDPPLGATLSVPEDARFAALIIQGSGTHDRDGNMIATGFRSTLYRRVARELAQRCGVASLRFDKRGYDKPPAYPHDYTISQRLADAAAALELLQGRPEVRGLPLFVIGHSEGALVAAKLAESNSVAGAACLAAPFGNLFELYMHRALRRLEQSTGAARAKAELAVEFGHRLEGLFKEGARVLPEEFVELARPYLGAGYDGWESFDWLAGHWAGALQSSPEVPMLVVQGGRDARLWPDNAQRWKAWCAGRPRASYEYIEHMGHDLNDARHKVFRVDDEVLNTICKWLGRISKEPATR